MASSPGARVRTRSCSVVATGGAIGCGRSRLPVPAALLRRMTLADSAPVSSNAPEAKAPPTAFGKGFV
ncbi:MAG: hypothetical protein EON88_27050, partial [Brevundimonas sp.]